MSKTKIKVPATTANLGPGFDSIGAALNMYNTFSFDTACDCVSITGCPNEFCNKDNLVYRAYKATLQKLGIKNDNVSINIKTVIPIARGLGSSSSLLVAGVLAANSLFNGNLSNEDILNIAIEFEGHADNLSPAIYGGLTASFVKSDCTFVRKYTINQDWNFLTLVPDFALETSVARATLPNSVKLTDAIFNISHSALLLKAFETCDEDLLFESMKDKLHQDCRKDLISGYDNFKQFSNENKIPFCISGAGSTLLFVTKSSSNVNAITNLINNKFSKHWKLYKLKADIAGAQII